MLWMTVLWRPLGMWAKRLSSTSPLCAALPSVEFLFLQAPVSWQTSSQQFLPAWLEYLGEYDGANEDDVCSEALAETTASLTEVIGSLGGEEEIRILAWFCWA